MSGLNLSEFNTFARHVVKKCLEYWSQITFFLGSGATGFAFMSLYSYFFVLDRVDLFIDSLEMRSALVVWVFLVLLFLMGSLVMLGATTWLFGVLVALGSRYPQFQLRFALFLCVPVIVGFSVLVGIGFFFYKDVPANYIILIQSLAVVVVFLLLLWLTSLKGIIYVNWGRGMLPRRRWVFWGFCSFTAAIVVLLTLFAAFPILLMLGSYVGEDTPGAMSYIAFLAMIILVLTLSPVIFFLAVSGPLFKKLGASAVALMFMFAIFFLAMPGALGVVAYSAAEKLGVRQGAAGRFVLSKDFDIQDLDSMMWKSTLNRSGGTEVSGFQIFSLGDVLLICPESIMGLHPRELRKYTKYCVRTLNSKVVRKPLKPSVAAIRPQEKVCSVPRWRLVAGNLLGWESLKLGL